MSECLFEDKECRQGQCDGCGQPSAASAGYGPDLERRTREGRLTFSEAIAKLRGRHCQFVERHGLRLRLSETMYDKVVTEDHKPPDLRVDDYLADNWHIVRP